MSPGISTPAAGERFGFELTFFRFALAPRWGDGCGCAGCSGREAGSAGARGRFIWDTSLLPMLLTSSFGLRRSYRGVRLGWLALGCRLCGCGSDDWSLRAAPGAAAGATDVGRDDVHWTLHAAESGYELTLDAQALQQAVLNGDRGFSRKSSDVGSASYYYSIPRVAVRGQLLRDGQPVDGAGARLGRSRVGRALRSVITSRDGIGLRCNSRMECVDVLCIA